MTLCNYWKVIPLIDWPSHRYLYLTNQCSTSRVPLHGSLYWKKY